MKPVPAKNITLLDRSRQKPVGEYYLKKKLQCTPLYVEDNYVTTTLPHTDYCPITFFIQSIDYDKKCDKNFGDVYMITPETSFEEIISEAEEEKE